MVLSRGQHRRRAFHRWQLVNDVPPKDRDIAMVFQNYALYPHMSCKTTWHSVSRSATSKAELTSASRNARILDSKNSTSANPSSFPEATPARRRGPRHRPQAQVFLSMNPFQSRCQTPRTDGRRLIELHDKLQLPGSTSPMISRGHDHGEDRRHEGASSSRLARPLNVKIDQQIRRRFIVPRP